MRELLVISLVGGCAFQHGSAGDPAGGGPGGPGGTGPDAGSVNRPACDLSDPAVQLCLDFETADLGLDSSAGHHDATVVQAIAMTRLAEQAVTVGPTSSIHVAETPALDITGAITVELWVDPSPFGAYTALDNMGQYTLTLSPDGKLHCAIAGAMADSKDPISMNQWTHAGCTYDGSQLILFVNGSVSHCTNASAPIATANMNGTSIGRPFTGGLDNVHVLSRAVAASEMCAHAGRSDCNSSCD